MKNSFIIMLSVLALFVIVGCDKLGKCNNYNQEPKPELIKDGFNTCKAINRNFTYAVRNKSEYPYWSSEGDTLWVYGFMKVMGQMVLRDDSYWNIRLFDDVDAASTNNTSAFFVNVGIPVDMVEMDTVDLSCRCYLKGVLTFDNRHWDIIGDDGSGCYFPQCGLLVTEITIN